MLKILKAYGIPDQIVDAIGKMYEHTRAKVISPDGKKDLFDILSGVLQGDTLAPYLFVIVLDYALRMVYWLQERRAWISFWKKKR